MGITFEKINDKIEFFKAYDLDALEKSIEGQIEINKALMLKVHTVQYQVHTDDKSGRNVYTAMVHFKA